MTTLLSTSIQAMPSGFVYVTDSRMLYEISYFGSENFIGRPIDGYQNKVCILTEPAATALIAAQDELAARHPGYVFKIFDTYRPKQAVAHFVRWSKDPKDQLRKYEYYPELNKPDLFKLGYIFERSSHSRGSTVDLTIAKPDPNNPSKHIELEMGTPFDYFDEASHTDTTKISEEAQQNRKLLADLMQKYGFVGIREEWWHFTLKEEPFPDTYFDFPVA